MSVAITALYAAVFGLAIVTLSVSRVPHVIGMAGEQDIRPARAGGALLTNATIAVAALGILYPLVS